MSGHCDYLPSALSASSSACHGLLIITIDNAVHHKAGDKMPERAGDAAITDMQMRQRDVAALDAKYTKELADAKAENDVLCVMMLPLVVVGYYIKAVCQSVREACRLRRG